MLQCCIPIESCDCGNVLEAVKENNSAVAKYSHHVTRTHG